MSPKPFRLAVIAGVLAAVAALGATALTGCSTKVSGSLLPNQRPSVELTNAPVAPDHSNPYFYAYRVNWSGNDPDGRVDHYQYAVDPPHVVVKDTSKCNNGDTCWITTARNEEIVFFRATVPDSVRGNNPPTASDEHTFVIKAIDNGGMPSEPKFRSFFSFTIAPTVTIINPLPTALLSAQVTPSVRIEWEGHDVDGQFTQKPIKYKYRLLNIDIPENRVFLSDPDSLKRLDAPRAWAGWDSTSADTQFVQFTNLIPSTNYLFSVIAFDEAGAYSPVFTLNSNCLQFTAGFAASNGPRIHLFNEFIDFVYPSGGYSTDPLREIPLEIPTKTNINVNWEAFPSPGSRIQYFRWMVDGNVNDETPRSDENLDYIHWTQPSPTMPGAVTLRPFLDGIHRFYLECADNNGQKSLGIFKMTAVTPTFNRSLLVIDDTRLEVDKFIGDASHKIPDNYTQPWPSRTEFDTFFFARGNVPWRATKNPTSGVLSQPGLFAGYQFDTLGTRLGLENPARGVLLSKIGQYQHIIWLVDDKGALNNGSQDQTVAPITALVAMSGPGLASTLEAYTQLGGRVWMAGGGAAYASLQLFDRRNNNSGQNTVFSSVGTPTELAPSRIMYDGAHWQSELSVTKSQITTTRYDYSVRVRHPDNTEHDTTYIVTPAWSHPDHYNPGLSLNSPNYSKLPPQMRLKSPGTDPVPPTRTPAQANSFYLSSLACEYISDLNAILEDVDPDPQTEHNIVVLDTLFMANNGSVLRRNPAPTMTYYHGSTAHQFVFTGFSLWSYARQDCMQLVDFVLQDIWDLTRDESIDRGTIAPSIRSGVSPTNRVVTPAPRSVRTRVQSGTNRE